jgi:hypothetical protein
MSKRSAHTKPDAAAATGREVPLAAGGAKVPYVAIIDPALKIMVDAVRRYEGYGAPRRRGKEAPMGT